MTKEVTKANGVVKAKGTVKAKIFRYNPDTDLYPCFKTYEVSIGETITVLQILKQVFEEQDRTLCFRYFSCGFKFCNSCMMMINGKARHACLTLVNPGDEIVLEPLRNYPIIRDLAVDFGRSVYASDGTYQILSGTIVRKIPK